MFETKSRNYYEGAATVDYAGDGRLITMKAQDVHVSLFYLHGETQGCTRAV